MAVRTDPASRADVAAALGALLAQLRPLVFLPVTPWGELTERGKFRRLRPLAREALQHYTIAPERITFVGGFTNAIFRIDTAEATYALRIDYMQDHTGESTAIELAWLTALAVETDLDVCRVVASKAGEQSVSAGAPGVPGERRCVLFEWIPGKPLDDDMTPQRYRQLGAMSAGLHLHGAAFEPPSRPMAWDKVFYWPEDVDPVVYNLSQHRAKFPKGGVQVLDRAIAAVTPAFSLLEPGAAQIIHADVHPWNVHVARSRMIVLDFEDVAWGHRVQDIATTLFYGRDLPQYADLREAFEEGYRTMALWPVSYEGEPEHFMAARTIMFANFVLNLDDDPAEYLATAIPRLENFLRTWA